MRKASKLVIIILIVLGVAFSFLNFVSVDNMAISRTMGYDGTYQTDTGECKGEPLNCYNKGGGLPK